MRDQNGNSKGKWFPILAILAVLLVALGLLARGCAYANDPTPAETGGQTAPDAPGR